MMTGQPVAGSGLVLLEGESAGTGQPVLLPASPFSVAVPQLVQYRNDGGLPCPHVPQARASSVPQSPQKLAPLGFSNPQLKQVMLIAKQFCSQISTHSVSMSCR
jgi:hypothetical protein